MRSGKQKAISRVKRIAAQRHIYKLDGIPNDALSNGFERV